MSAPKRSDDASAEPADAAADSWDEAMKAIDGLTAEVSELAKHLVRRSAPDGPQPLDEASATS